MKRNHPGVVATLTSALLLGVSSVALAQSAAEPAVEGKAGAAAPKRVIEKQGGEAPKAERAEPQAERAEKAADRAERKQQASDAKATRAEERAERKAERAEKKAEKAAKADAKGDKAEAKAAKADADADAKAKKADARAEEAADKADAKAQKADAKAKRAEQAAERKADRVERKAERAERRADQADKKENAAAAAQPDAEKPSDASATAKSEQAKPEAREAVKQTADTEKPADAKRETQAADANAERAEPEKVRTVRLRGERRTRVIDRLAEHRKERKARRYDRANVTISIGSAIPTAWTYYELPPQIVEIEPVYRNYHYVVVEDDYVIVNPRTRKIVKVIRADGSDDDFEVTQRMRRDILNIVDRSGLSISIGALSIDIGKDVPDRFERRRFPADLVDRYPELDDHRYVVTKRNVLVVDPNNGRLVARIARG
ncbi:MAG: DUF1236 domain-containing protein [Pseudomonadota bacterium]